MELRGIFAVVGHLKRRPIKAGKAVLTALKGENQPPPDINPTTVPKPLPNHAPELFAENNRSMSSRRSGQERPEKFLE